MEAIFTATKVAAEVLGVGDKVGTVEVGKQADLLVLPENPYDDIKALRKIQIIVKRGQVVHQ